MKKPKSGNPTLFPNTTGPVGKASQLSGIDGRAKFCVEMEADSFGAVVSDQPVKRGLEGLAAEEVAVLIM
jgi:hypothetical protein